MRKIAMILKFGIITSLLLLVLPKIVSAQSVYPIAELGFCRDAKECFYYCEIPQNSPSCWSYRRYVLGKNVLGETTTNPDEMARAHGVTFPIPELGNCQSATACMQYCNLPENHIACSEFGRKKGIIKNNETQPDGVNKITLIEEAKKLLGCDSETTCRAFCENPDNRQRCESFAQSQGLRKLSKLPLRPSIPPVIFDSAKQELGCDSAASCKEICTKPENYQKCRDFAQNHNLTIPDASEKTMREPSGTMPKPPCSDKQSCMKWCQYNPEGCRDFVKSQNEKLQSNQTYMPHQASPLKQGCTNDKECFQYCQIHQDQCPGFSKNNEGSASGMQRPFINISPQYYYNPEIPHAKPQELPQSPPNQTNNAQFIPCYDHASDGSGLASGDYCPTGYKCDRTPQPKAPFGVCQPNK